MQVTPGYKSENKAKDEKKKKVQLSPENTVVKIIMLAKKKNPSEKT